MKDKRIHHDTMDKLLQHDTVDILRYSPVFKPGVLGLRPCMPSFLKSFLLVHWYVCMSVCVSAPEDINNQWYDMV